MIECKTVLSEREVLSGFVHHQRIKYLLLRIGQGLGLILLLLVLASFFSAGVSFRALISGGLVPVLLFCFFILLPYAVIWTTRRHIRTNPNLNKEIIWRFDENGIRGVGPEFNFAQKWGTFHHARTTRQGILLYPEKHVFYWIPRSGFANDLAFEQAGQLVTHKISK